MMVSGAPLPDEKQMVLLPSLINFLCENVIWSGGGPDHGNLIL